MFLQRFFWLLAVFYGVHGLYRIEITLKLKLWDDYHAVISIRGDMCNDNDFI